jgi:CRISPR/Cas system-associated exonuclease Cas4 (RecB family)
LYYPGATSVIKYRKRHIEPDFEERMAAYKFKSEIALDFGTRVDQNVESLIENQKYFPGEEDNHVRQASMSLHNRLMRELPSDHTYKTQLSVCSPKLWVLGAIDLMMEPDDPTSPSVIRDIKTTEKVKQKKWASDYLYQLALYSACYGEQTGRRVEQGILDYWVKSERRMAKTRFSREELISGYKEMVYWCQKFRVEYFEKVNCSQ